MFYPRSISRFSVRVGSLNQASRILGSKSESAPFHLNSPSQNYSAFSGSRNSKDHAHTLANASTNLLGSLGLKWGFLKVDDNASPPSALNFRSYIHSASPKEFESGDDPRPMNFARGVTNENEQNEFEMGRNSRPMNFFRGVTNENRPNESEMGRNSRPMNFFRGVMNENRATEFETGRPSRPMSFVRGVTNDNRPNEFELGRDSRPMNFVRGVMNENRSNGFRGPQFSHHEVEKETADIVHIKLIRNNAFVTVTDSKGNKKIGASSGSLGGKFTQYSADTAAEHVGRLAKNMGLKSFVVKVNGSTFFKKKKQAILSFRDGFTNSRNDQNPIVYIEDTTRKAHNGCRLRKQRRI